MKINDNIVISFIDDNSGGIVFDTDSGSYYKLNSTAYTIIDYIKNHTLTDTAQLIQAVCEAYDISCDDAKSDVEGLLRELTENGIIS